MVFDHVKPEREGKVNQTTDSKTYADQWWLFGKVRPELRNALHGLSRYIATVETAKHRIFVFLDAVILPDNKLVAFAFEDAYQLGVMMSQVHLTWTAANSGRIGFGNDPVYVKTRCFDPFPFPHCTGAQQQTIRDFAERIDAHRKRQQQLQPWLTLTQTHNVLERLWSGEGFTEQDHIVYDVALVGILRELHDELDRAVFDAYGWPHDLTIEQILEHIVALNATRRAEEASGLIRWLRPEYQAPDEIAVPRALEGFLEEVSPTATRRKQPWPPAIPDQFRVVREMMRSAIPQSSQQIAASFRPAPRTRVAEILETLTALGQAREFSGRYSL